MDEKQRLLKMLNENKISENDFQILSAVLDKKPTRLMRVLSFSVNPFQKIAGIQALLIGVAIILLTSYLGFHAQQYYVNIMVTSDTNINLQPRVAYTFWLVLYQNVICCLSLSLCYLLFAKLLQRNSVRLVDFFGMVALARLPFLINALFILVVQHFAPDFIHAHNLLLQSSWLEIVFSLQNMLLGLWMLILYFNAMKEASGLTGGKLWFSVAISFIVASVMGSELTMFFV